ncbi:uncharacterized protein LOC131672054 [Phymastichus coffea]|uniref:uncharacterized protein LOC131672054 n=1 Tax=Phymastichus coffea TaxID=108790 RepID=UPI00273B94FF|nr:uncharacterized protein LOC131672054 [Phymastichus coffea]
MVNETIRQNESNIERSTKSIADVVIKEDIQMIVDRALGSSYTIISYALQQFPGKNLGFMAAHRNLIVTVYNETVGQEEEHSFFVKSMPYGVDSQVSLIEDAGAFRKETTYYNKMVPELVASVEDSVWGAECFLVKNDVMVFENLKSKNFNIKEKFLDIRFVKAALLALAKLHSASILTEERLGKNLLELYPEILTDRLYLREGKTYDWCLAGVEVAIAVAKHLKLDFTLIRQVCDRVYEAILPSKSMRNGICHGDMWSYNLLFDDSKPLPKCLMVDYQIIRYAPIMTDVSLLFYLTTRRIFRKQYETELLTYYHEALCKKLKENHYQAELPTLNSIFYEFEQIRIVGIVTALLYFPIILLEGEESSDSTKSSDNYVKLQFRDRVGVVLDVIQKDMIYREKIKEIVEEIVERAENLLAA